MGCCFIPMSGNLAIAKNHATRQPILQVINCIEELSKPIENKNDFLKLMEGILTIMR